MDFREAILKVSRVLGLTLTGGVIALLLWLHLFGSAAVEVDAPWPGNEVPDVLICNTAPAWTMVAVPRAIEFWRQHGHKLGDAKASDCRKLCPMNDTGRMAPCEWGAIVIDLRDGGFSEDHADEAFSGRANGSRVWATVLVAEEISSESPLPPDIEALVATHGLGHALGYGHSKTEIGGPFSSEKTGEVMSPTLEKLGWGDEGLGK